MLRQTVILLVALIAVALVLGGCSAREEEVPAAEESDAGSETISERSSSDAARARGLPVIEEGAEDDRPIVTLEDVKYEWRIEPYKGLYVTVEFGNANEVFERARAYVFVVVHYSARASANRGVFPPGTELDESGPADYTGGTHVLYRKDYTMKCFIPYAYREGYYDSMRIIVYSEGGELLIDQEYDLDVKGEPTGVVRTKPILTL